MRVKGDIIYMLCHQLYKVEFGEYDMFLSVFNISQHQFKNFPNSPDHSIRVLVLNKEELLKNNSKQGWVILSILVSLTDTLPSNTKYQYWYR